MAPAEVAEKNSSHQAIQAIFARKERMGDHRIRISFISWVTTGSVSSVLWEAFAMHSLCQADISDQKNTFTVGLPSPMHTHPVLKIACHLGNLMLPCTGNALRCSFSLFLPMCLSSIRFNWLCMTLWGESASLHLPLYVTESAKKQS